MQVVDLDGGGEDADHGLNRLWESRQVAHEYVAKNDDERGVERKLQWIHLPPRACQSGPHSHSLDVHAVVPA